jgi:hypothetical protein
VENFMKRTALVVAAALALCVAQAYAGEQDVAPAAQAGTTAVMSQADSASAQRVAPMSGEVAHVGKTRADVYQELIRAEKDGSLARLTAQLYNGS